jgi:uncharacterized lipoprotein YehR (DUF1307 family)
MYGKEDAKRYREEHCIISLENDRYGGYDDEVLLKVAHNGRQYSTISFSKQEAEKAIALLKAHFGI